jgi:hypothetical protein
MEFGCYIDRELGVGHNGPEPILSEVVVEAVPSGAVDRVAGTCSRHDRLGLRQDALRRSPSVENHSIDLVAEVGDLLLEFVDGVDLVDELLHGVELDGEVRYRRIDFLLPHPNLLGLLLKGLHAVIDVVVAPLKVLESLLDDVEAAVDVITHLLHLFEKQLGSGVHGVVDVLLEASKVVVMEIQPGTGRIEARCGPNSEIKPGHDESRSPETTQEKQLTQGGLTQTGAPGSAVSDTKC